MQIVSQKYHAPLQKPADQEEQFKIMDDRNDPSPRHPNMSHFNTDLNSVRSSNNTANNQQQWQISSQLQDVVHFSQNQNQSQSQNRNSQQPSDSDAIYQKQRSQLEQESDIYRQDEDFMHQNRAQTHKDIFGSQEDQSNSQYTTTNLQQQTSSSQAKQNEQRRMKYDQAAYDAEKNTLNDDQEDGASYMRGSSQEQEDKANRLRNKSNLNEESVQNQLFEVNDWQGGGKLLQNVKVQGSKKFAKIGAPRGNGHRLMQIKREQISMDQSRKAKNMGQKSKNDIKQPWVYKQAPAATDHNHLQSSESKERWQRNQAVQGGALPVNYGQKKGWNKFVNPPKDFREKNLDSGSSADVVPYHEQNSREQLRDERHRRVPQNSSNIEEPVSVNIENVVPAAKFKQFESPQYELPLKKIKKGKFVNQEYRQTYQNQREQQTKAKSVITSRKNFVKNDLSRDMSHSQASQPQKQLNVYPQNILKMNYVQDYRQNSNSDFQTSHPYHNEDSEEIQGESDSEDQQNNRQRQYNPANQRNSIEPIMQSNQESMYHSNHNRSMFAQRKASEQIQHERRYFSQMRGERDDRLVRTNQEDQLLMNQEQKAGFFTKGKHQNEQQQIGSQHQAQNYSIPVAGQAQAQARKQSLPSNLRNNGQFLIDQEQSQIQNQLPNNINLHSYQYPQQKAANNIYPPSIHQNQYSNRTLKMGQNAQTIQDYAQSQNLKVPLQYGQSKRDEIHKVASFVSFGQQSGIHSSDDEIVPPNHHYAMMQQPVISQMPYSFSKTTGGMMSDSEATLRNMSQKQLIVQKRATFANPKKYAYNRQQIPKKKLKNKQNRQIPELNLESIDEESLSEMNQQLSRQNRELKMASSSQILLLAEDQRTFRKLEVSERDHAMLPLLTMGKTSKINQSKAVTSRNYYTGVAQKETLLALGIVSKAGRKRVFKDKSKTRHLYEGVHEIPVFNLKIQDLPVRLTFKFIVYRTAVKVYVEARLLSIVQLMMRQNNPHMALFVNRNRQLILELSERMAVKHLVQNGNDFGQLIESELIIANNQLKIEKSHDYLVQDVHATRGYFAYEDDIQNSLSALKNTKQSSQTIHSGTLQNLNLMSENSQERFQSTLTTTQAHNRSLSKTEQDQERRDFGEDKREGQIYEVDESDLESEDYERYAGREIGESDFGVMGQGQRTQLRGLKRKRSKAETTRLRGGVADNTDLDLDQSYQRKVFGSPTKSEALKPIAKQFSTQNQTLKPHKNPSGQEVYHTEQDKDVQDGMADYTPHFASVKKSNKIVKEPQNNINDFTGIQPVQKYLQKLQQFQPNTESEYTLMKAFSPKQLSDSRRKLHERSTDPDQQEQQIAKELFVQEQRRRNRALEEEKAQRQQAWMRQQQKLQQELTNQIDQDSVGSSSLYLNQEYIHGYPIEGNQQALNKNGIQIGKEKIKMRHREQTNNNFEAQNSSPYEPQQSVRNQNHYGEQEIMQNYQEGIGSYGAEDFQSEIPQNQWQGEQNIPQQWNQQNNYQLQSKSALAGQKRRKISKNNSNRFNQENQGNHQQKQSMFNQVLTPPKPTLHLTQKNFMQTTDDRNNLPQLLLLDKNGVQSDQFPLNSTLDILSSPANNMSTNQKQNDTNIRAAQTEYNNQTTPDNNPLFQAQNHQKSPLQDNSAHLQQQNSSSMQQSQSQSQTHSQEDQNKSRSRQQYLRARQVADQHSIIFEEDLDSDGELDKSTYYQQSAVKNNFSLREDKLGESDADLDEESENFADRQLNIHNERGNSGQSRGQTGHRTRIAGAIQMEEQMDVGESQQGENHSENGLGESETQKTLTVLQHH